MIAELDCGWETIVDPQARVTVIADVNGTGRTGLVVTDGTSAVEVPLTPRGVAQLACALWRVSPAVRQLAELMDAEDAAEVAA